MFHLCGSHDPVPEIHVAAAFVSSGDVRATAVRITCLKCGQEFPPAALSQMPMRLNEHVTKACMHFKDEASDHLKGKHKDSPVAGRVLSLHALRWLDGMENPPYVVKLPTPRSTT